MKLKAAYFVILNGNANIMDQKKGHIMFHASDGDIVQ